MLVNIFNSMSNLYHSNDKYQGEDLHGVNNLTGASLQHAHEAEDKIPSSEHSLEHNFISGFPPNMLQSYRSMDIFHNKQQNVLVHIASSVSGQEENNNFKKQKTLENMTIHCWDLSIKKMPSIGGGYYDAESVECLYDSESDRDSFAISETSSNCSTINGISKTMVADRKMTMKELCASRPCLLVKTHFTLVVSSNSRTDETDMAIGLMNEITTAVNSCTNEFDFSLVSKAPLEWKGKYVKGNKSCMVTIFIYIDEIDCNRYSKQADDSDCSKNLKSLPLDSFTLIVEVVKTSGDSKPFFDFYRGFKLAMTGIDGFAANTTNINELNCIDSIPCRMLSDAPPLCPIPTDIMIDNTLTAIRQLHAMAREPFFEAKLEASRMLYDLSLRDQMILNNPRIIEAIIPILADLIKNRRESFPEVIEQAIVACGSFCENPCYRRPILAQIDCILVILQFVGNPGKNEYFFDTAQVRRESARIISILCSTDVHGFIMQLEVCKVSWKKWLCSLDYIRDPRIKPFTQKIQQVINKRYLKGNHHGNRETHSFNHYYYNGYDHTTNH